MDELKHIFDIVIVTTLFLWLAAVFVWAVGVQRYIERNGGHATSYSGFALRVFAGPFQDYIEARHIAKRTRHVPLSLRTFELLMGAAIVGVISVVGHKCFMAA